MTMSGLNPQDVIRRYQRARERRSRRYAFFDLETFLAAPERPFPQPVCLSYCEAVAGPSGEAWDRMW